MDPVTLGLCSQIDLDFEVEKAAKNLPPQEAQPEGATLLPASETTAPSLANEPEGDAPGDAAREADAVFAKLKSMTGPATPDDE